MSNQTQETKEMENAAQTEAHPANEEFQNDRVRVEVTKKPGCLVRLTVKMTPEAVKTAHENAVKAVRKEVSIPGFRKGKVPEDIVKHNFASAIVKEHKDTVLQSAFDESLSLTHLKPFSRNSLRRSELKKFSAEEGAEAVFEFETAPTVPTIDMSAIQTRATKPREITEKHASMSYKHLQLMQASWEEVPEKTVELGDFVELDIDVTQHPAHNVCIDQLFWIEEGESPKWIIEAVVGMILNESKETTAAPQPEDPPYPIVYEENQPHKECRITVKKIKKAILPEENEEFARSCGAPSIEVLKKIIGEQIVHEETEYAKELNRYNLRRELIERYRFDIPESLVNAEIRERMANIKKGADLKKGSLPTDQNQIEQMRATVESETRGFFAWMFLIQPFSGPAKVTVSHEELEAELNKQMRFPRDKRLVYPDQHPEDIRNRLFMLVMMRKCEDYLLSQLPS